jgi:hypothetical protein
MSKGYDFIECGCCGSYHRADYFGDCRNDSERLELENIPVGARITSVEQQMEDEKSEMQKR